MNNTAVLFGSNQGNANAHDPRNLPIFLVGGNYQHGRYIAHNQAQNTPLSNIVVSMLNNIGVETDAFATSNGQLNLSDADRI